MDVPAAISAEAVQVDRTFRMALKAKMSGWKPTLGPIEEDAAVAADRVSMTMRRAANEPLGLADAARTKQTSCCSRCAR